MPHRFSNPERTTSSTLVENYVSPSQGLESQKSPHQSAFAGAIFPDNAKVVPGIQEKGDIVDDIPAVILHGDMLTAEQVHDRLPPN